MINTDGYLKYLDRHRAFVLEEARKLGVEARGLAHDLSKYGDAEFLPYAEYFYGGYERGKVPAQVQEAFDSAWLHHQHANDHHWQHWTLREDSGVLKVLPMSDGARREMLADWRGAGKAIMGDKADTRAWFEKNRANILLHPETLAWVEANLSDNTEELVERGMKIVNRLIEATGPCAQNPHGERHCFHWRGQPPTLRTRVQADCCWCGVTRTFGYEDVMDGNAPISVRPSGAVHGPARNWLDQPTTYALGRLSPKGAARQHAEKMARHAER